MYKMAKNGLKKYKEPLAIRIVICIPKKYPF